MSNGPSHDESFRREIDARVGRTLCQRYTLEAVLGVGATGAVYRASHRNGNRVAIKVLHTELSATKEARERFLRDAYVANQVEHPGALRILDDDTTEDGTVFYVTDLLEGQTLADMLARQGRLPPAELASLMIDVLDVLAAAHAKGVVHRSLAPSCIFVTQSRAVRVMDFGVDRLADGGHVAARIGRAMDASAYVAPEQARGETASVDPRTDLWAVGAIMFRALEGGFVHRAETPQMVRIQAATQAAPALLAVVPDCAPNLAEIVDRALAWKREDRWANAGAIQTALRAGRIVSVQPPPPAPAQGSWRPGPAPFAAPPVAPLAPLPYAPNYGAPSSTDNGWIKWVAGAAAVIVLFVVGGGAALFLLIRSPSPHAKADAGTKTPLVWSDQGSPVPVSSRDPLWGRRDAPVTVVVFSDFECPFCARVEPTLEEVRQTYGANKVRIVWKNQPLPFHHNAKPAAEAAQVVFALAGSDAFFRFHDSAFKNQTNLTPANFRLWATAAGVDGKAFDKAIATHSGLAKVDEDMDVARVVGATGTPSFRINGVELSGAQPFARFKQIIDTELGKAAAKTATGTPADALYVVLSTENFKRPTTSATDDEEVVDDTTVWRVPVFGSPIRGNVDAPVTIVEFGDFQCPFCKRSEQTLDKIRETYGDKVRLVWKHEPLPFHPRAEPAAELALEARAQKGDAGFFRAHDALFEAQPKLDDDDLAKIAAQLGLDTGRVKLAIRDKKHAAQINADMDLGEDVQATGTPHFFINGRRMTGAQPFEKFQQLIDEELKKFDAKRGTVAAKDYYASLMRDATAAPEPEKKRAPPVPAGTPFRGGKNASVVIQEWADFQCPFCARVEPTLQEIMKLYGDRVKIVWHDRPLPMHPDAELAAELAREALEQRGPDAFWKMHDKLFANQRKLKREDLDVYAADLGLDRAKVARALDGKTHEAAIDADEKLSVELGITGTPSFLINDYYVSGAQPIAKFKKLIDRALLEPKR